MNIGVFRKIVDSILESLPPGLYRQLNGGVLVIPDLKEDGEGTGGRLPFWFSPLQ